MSRYIIDADARQGITQPANQKPARRSEYIDADEEQIRKLTIRPRAQPAILEA